MPLMMKNPSLVREIIDLGLSQQMQKFPGVQAIIPKSGDHNLFFVWLIENALA
jgi:hypothetical protein